MNILIFLYKKVKNYIFERLKYIQINKLKYDKGY